MNNDRELLERAARAAGIAPVLCYESKRNCLRIGTRNSYRLWRPLQSYDDAMPMAVRMEIWITSANVGNPNGYTSAEVSGDNGFVEMHRKHEGDADIATRRAIVRAAASLDPAA